MKFEGFVSREKVEGKWELVNGYATMDDATCEKMEKAAKLLFDNEEMLRDELSLYNFLGNYEVFFIGESNNDNTMYIVDKYNTEYNASESREDIKEIYHILRHVIKNGKVNVSNKKNYGFFRNSMGAIEVLRELFNKEEVEEMQLPENEVYTRGDLLVDIANQVNEELNIKEEQILPVVIPQVWDIITEFDYEFKANGHKVCVSYSEDGNYLEYRIIDMTNDNLMTMKALYDSEIDNLENEVKKDLENIIKVNGVMNAILTESDIKEIITYKSDYVIEIEVIKGIPFFTTRWFNETLVNVEYNEFEPGDIKLRHELYYYLEFMKDRIDIRYNWIMDGEYYV